jgi:hypothetical protein
VVQRLREAAGPRRTAAARERGGNHAEAMALRDLRGLPYEEAKVRAARSLAPSHGGGEAGACAGLYLAVFRASPKFMGLISLGLAISVFCNFVYSVLLQMY